jgi:serine/threonine-protein kinase
LTARLSFTDAREQSVAEARLGTQLSGRWRITELLGIGGTSIVYGGEHRNGHLVAIKVLRPELAADPQIASRFLAEGYVANKIGHPAIVAILDDDRTDDGVPFLVMERLHGESLHWRLRRTGPLRVLEVLATADRVLEALEIAHHKGILHRDLKPENIFLTHRREIKLLDFGIARWNSAGVSRAGTLSGMVMGTPAFMPPEQARGQWNCVNERSDLFSLCASLFVLLTNRSPREAETPNLELLAAMTQPFPGLRDVEPEMPDGVAALVDRGLTLEPEGRWSSAREMRAAVHAAWASVSATTVPGMPNALETGEGGLWSPASPETSGVSWVPVGASTAVMTAPNYGGSGPPPTPIASPWSGAGVRGEHGVGDARRQSDPAAGAARSAALGPRMRRAWIWSAAAIIGLVATLSAVRWSKRGVVAAHETATPSAVAINPPIGSAAASSFDPLAGVEATASPTAGPATTAPAASPEPVPSELTVPVESIPRTAATHAPVERSVAPIRRGPPASPVPLPVSATPSTGSASLTPAASARPYDPFDRRR